MLSSRLTRNILLSLFCLLVVSVFLTPATLSVSEGIGVAMVCVNFTAPSNPQREVVVMLDTTDGSSLGMQGL